MAANASRRLALKSDQQITVAIAEGVMDRGFKRLIGAIEPFTIERTLQNISSAVTESKMLPDELKARIAEVKVT
ncbi:hypothetical protein G7Y89_g4311 [Cudoniella acicularis]|uniref:Uncharacterized protein n=1 Tax=Cudoniella acicularis TaxID=354080 RepID=A0A8H4RRW6_9HELO|nr:hypothetical protein G7Y89_g4311 [Cudoniella acicularis]